MILSRKFLTKMYISLLPHVHACTNISPLIYYSLTPSQPFCLCNEVNEVLPMILIGDGSGKGGFSQRTSSEKNPQCYFLLYYQFDRESVINNSHNISASYYACLIEGYNTEIYYPLRICDRN